MRNKYAGHKLSDLRDAYDLNTITYTACSQPVLSLSVREHFSDINNKALRYLAEQILPSELERKITRSLICYREISRKDDS
jgi:hypothetical protein